MGAYLRRGKNQKSSLQCVTVELHFSNRLLFRWPFQLSGKTDLREKRDVIGDDPHCASWAAAEPENMPAGKASFGEVKRLKFFILEIENNLPHNPAPLLPFHPEYHPLPPENEELVKFEGQVGDDEEIAGEQTLSLSREFLNVRGSCSPGQRPSQALTHLNTLYAQGLEALDGWK